MVIQSAIGDASDVADDVDRLPINEKGKCKIRLLAIQQWLFMPYRRHSGKGIEHHDLPKLNDSVAAGTVEGVNKLEKVVSRYDCPEAIYTLLDVPP